MTGVAAISWSQRIILLLLLFSAFCSCSETFDLKNVKSPFVEDFLRGIRTYNRSGLVGEDAKCVRQLEELVKIQNDKRAIRMFDSWGKLPSGILSGHLRALGHYDQCVQISVDFESAELGHMNGQYCTATIRATEELLPHKQVRLFRNDPMWGAREENPFNTHLQIGICVPHSCAPHVIEQVIGEYVTIAPKSCSVAGKSEFKAENIVAIVLFSVIAALILASSVYEYVVNQTGGDPRPLFIAFSIWTNSRKLFDIKTTASPNSIECLHGLRVLSMVWVIFGHSYMGFSVGSLMNPLYILKWSQQLFTTLEMNSSLSVDTFFFLSGFLVAYSFLREFQKRNGRLNVLFMYLHRYLRLTPVVAFAILFVVGLLKYFGSGPIWHEALAMAEPRCRDNWWVTLLYIQNYFRRDRICLGHSWYLAIDMQLFILSPLILIPLYKWGKKVIPVLVLLCLLSMGCVVATFYKYDINVFYLFHATSNERMERTYYPTHDRYTAWMIGVFLGYFFFVTKGRKIHLAKPVVIVGWTLSLGLMLALLFGTHSESLKGMGATSTVLAACLYEVLSRPVWAISIAWIVFACHNGYGGPVNSILSYPGWQPLGRLSYCMYISHVLVEVVNTGNSRTDANFTDYEVILYFWANFGVTIGVAIVMVLAFEAPMIAIDKILFGKGKQVTSAVPEAPPIPQKVPEAPPLPQKKKLELV